MTKDRSPTDYLSDTWGIEKSPDESDRGNPYRVDAPESPEWGLGPKGYTSYGHSDDVKYDPKADTWDMSAKDVAQGYSKPGDDAKEPGVASYEQNIPTTNEWDRGSGSATRAKEFKSTEGEGFDGVGHDKPSPGREALGSSKLVG